jgi:chemotaxis signal transduction protein
MTVLTSDTLRRLPGMLDGHGDELATLTLGGQTFALPIAAIVAVLDPVLLAHEPDREGAHWIGTLASRGGTIPVADGRVVYALDTEKPIGKIIVLRGEPLFALAVDDLLGSIRPGDGATRALPPLCGSGDNLLLDAAVWNDGELLLRIDPSALLSWLVTPAGTTAESAGTTMPSPEPGRDSRALLLEIDGEPYGLPVSWVRQISDDRVPVHLPRADAAIAGLVAWEGAPIPAFDGHLLLGLAPADREQGMLVVIGSPRDANGVLPAPLAALRVGAVIGVTVVAEWQADAILLANGRSVRPFDVHAILNLASPR